MPEFRQAKCHTRSEATKCHPWRHSSEPKVDSDICIRPKNVSKNAQQRSAVAISVTALMLLAVLNHANASPSCVDLCKNSWLPDERFVWLEVCSGNVADFNNRKSELGGVSSSFSCWSNGRIPSKDECWGSDRILTSGFLNQILFDESLRNAIPRTGVRIVGAYFPDAIDLSYGHIAKNLFLDKSRFESDVSLLGVQADGNVSFDGSRIIGELTLEGARISRNLWMRRSNTVPAAFRPRFSVVDLSHAKIEGQVSIIDAIIDTRLDMDSASVAADVFMRGAQLNSAHVRLIFSELGANLVLAGASLGLVDLSGSTIKGELRLVEGREVAMWNRDGAHLALINTETGALVETPASWPESVHPEGFVYERIGGFRQTNDQPVSDRPVDSFVWVARAETASFQPYEQLALVLRKEGRSRAADEVLFRGRQTERRRAHGDNLWYWLWLSMLEAVVGYGFKMFRALYWAARLIALGCIVLMWDGALRERKVAGVGFWFSVDYMLPVVVLNSAHFDNPNLGKFALSYFYVHRILGYVLVFFVIAGLSGIAK